jgi:hypothetical protein
MDPFGPYQVAANWPKDISTLPGNEKWTWGAGQGVFAESPDRVISQTFAHELLQAAPRDYRRDPQTEQEGVPA